jgi:hypothetical protein
MLFDEGSQQTTLKFFQIFGSYIYNMKLLSLFAASLLAGHVSAFHGQLASSGYIEIAGAPADTYQWIYLTDYATGSTYAGTVEGGWNNCADQQCWIK